MKTEYVYIMSGSEHNGKIKIGRTDKHPQVRADQLSKQTSSIGEFKVEWYREVENSEFIESFLHYIFRDFHFKKEYFEIDINSASRIADSATDYLLKIEDKLTDTYNEIISALSQEIEALEIVRKYDKGDDYNESIIILKSVEDCKIIKEKLENKIVKHSK